MAAQSFNMPTATLREGARGEWRISWSNVHLAVNTDLTEGSDTAYLGDLQFEGSNSSSFFTLVVPDDFAPGMFESSNIQMTSEWEVFASAITLRAAHGDLVIPGPQAWGDSMQPYTGVLPADVRTALDTWVGNLADRSAVTLILDDGEATSDGPWSDFASNPTQDSPWSNMESWVLVPSPTFQLPDVQSIDPLGSVVWFGINGLVPDVFRDPHERTVPELYLHRVSLNALLGVHSSISFTGANGAATTDGLNPNVEQQAQLLRISSANGDLVIPGPALWTPSDESNIYLGFLPEVARTDLAAWTASYEGTPATITLIAGPRINDTLDGAWSNFGSAGTSDGPWSNFGSTGTSDGPWSNFGATPTEDGPWSDFADNTTQDGPWSDFSRTTIDGPWSNFGVTPTTDGPWSDLLRHIPVGIVPGGLLFLATPDTPILRAIQQSMGYFQADITWTGRPEHRYFEQIRIRWITKQGTDRSTTPAPTRSEAMDWEDSDVLVDAPGGVFQYVDSVVDAMGQVLFGPVLYRDNDLPLDARPGFVDKPLWAMARLEVDEDDKYGREDPRVYTPFYISSERDASGAILRLHKGDDDFVPEDERWCVGAMLMLTNRQWLLEITVGGTRSEHALVPHYDIGSETVTFELAAAVGQAGFILHEVNLLAEGRSRWTYTWADPGQELPAGAYGQTALTQTGAMITVDSSVLCT